MEARKENTLTKIWREKKNSDSSKKGKKEGRKKGRKERRKEEATSTKDAFTVLFIFSRSERGGGGGGGQGGEGALVVLMV